MICRDRHRGNAAIRGLVRQLGTDIVYQPTVPITTDSPQPASGLAHPGQLDSPVWCQAGNECFAVGIRTLY